MLGYCYWLPRRVRVGREINSSCRQSRNMGVAEKHPPCASVAGTTGEETPQPLSQSRFPIVYDFWNSSSGLFRAKKIKIMLIIIQLPANLLRQSHIFSYEPPPGVKANLQHTFAALTAARYVKRYIHKYTIAYVSTEWTSIQWSDHVYISSLPGSMP